MKCCKCKKEINIAKKIIPSTWYGLYKKDELKRMICLECIKKPQNEKWWRL